MSRLRRFLFGEHSATKVAGIFASSREAERAAQALITFSGLTSDQVQVFRPGRRRSRGVDLERLVESERRGLGRTVVKVHAAMGALGFLIGTVLYAVLMAVGNAGLHSTPGVGFIGLAGLGTILGLLLGGALSLRPDEAHLIERIRTGLKKGNWVVVVRPQSSGQAQQAIHSLGGASLKVMRSF